MRVGGRCCSLVVGVVVLGWRLVAGLHYVGDSGVGGRGVGARGEVVHVPVLRGLPRYKALKTYYMVKESR